jgi:hypothetical protein
MDWVGFALMILPKCSPAKARVSMPGFEAVDDLNLADVDGPLTVFQHNPFDDQEIASITGNSSAAIVQTKVASGLFLGSSAGGELRFR